MRKPDFSQLVKVLERKKPDRPTLFEFFLNGTLHRRLTGIQEQPEWGSLAWAKRIAQSYAAAGYDYVTLHCYQFGFPTATQDRAKSISQNEGAVIFDRSSFEAYAWPNPDDAPLILPDMADIPEGMQLIPYGPGGVLENCIKLCGYENLAMLVLDDPQLAGDIFAAVGSRLVRYYERAGKLRGVGAMISNDDWGFAQQTMLSPEDMRKFVIPWHRKIAKTIHAAGVPAILHSCGNLAAVMDDIIDDIGYDAKHSYEDKIMPVEEAYVKYGRRIAIFGGIDVDFVCRASITDIQQRCRKMLDLASTSGGYALGTGNSVPEYVPAESYLAMIQVANPEARFVE